MKEKIDVLLATYNGEKYLKEQIDSILNQTYQNIHLIISDDCSKDETQKILKEYKEKDDRITVYIQEQNLGYIKNFEFLLEKVESDYYMLSDQDDVWLPEKIEKSMQTLKEKNADLVFGDLEVVDENLKTIYPSFGDFTGCTILSKKKFIKDILPVPSNSKFVPHDYWMALMVALRGKLAYMPEKYIKYRQHGNNQIGTDKISHKFKKLDQVRELFINVKLGVFGTYVENNDKFPKELQEQNKKALEYFEMLQNKKNWNFRGWDIYHKLYKNETFSYYILNFIILNLPFLGRGLFNIRYFVLKIMKKR